MSTTTALNAANFIIDNTAKEAAKLVRVITDTDIANATMDAEVNRSKGARVTVVNALELRLAELTADTPEEDTVVELDPEFAAEQPIVEGDEPDDIADDAVIVVGPPAVEPEVAPVPRTEVQTCAIAFFDAIKSGDSRLVATLLAEVRREGTKEFGQGEKDVEMADALIEASTMLKRTSKARKGTPGKRGSSEAVVERLTAAIKLAEDSAGDDCVVTEDMMETAGFPASWRKYSSLWAASGPAGRAIRELGYDPSLRKHGEGKGVYLTSTL